MLCIVATTVYKFGIPFGKYTQEQFQTRLLSQRFLTPSLVFVFGLLII